MHWNRFRATAAAAVFATLLLGGLVATPAAHAAIASTSITTPADLTFFISDHDAATQTFSISGTTTGSSPGDTVDIRCYNGPNFATVASNVALNADGSFSVPNAPLGPIEDGECRLAAIPTGVTPASLSSYAGPRVGVGERDTDTISGGPNDGKTVDYYLWSQQHEGAFDYVSLGGCGVYDGYLFDTDLSLTTTTFYCNAGLFNSESALNSRSELQVDGVNAYTPDGAAGIDSNATGLPALSYSYSVDPATGNLVLHESDPLVKCTDVSYPPDSTKCATFVSTGVTDNITITQDHAGHISWFTESFTSTNGAAHTLDLLWDQNQHFYGGGSGNSTQVEYEFPGQSSYFLPTAVVPNAGSTVSLPATSPGTILIRMHGAPDGDMSTGQGAIVYDRPATAANFTFLNSSDSEFTLHQTGTVPAGGATKFRFAFVQDYAAANVAAYAQTAAGAFLNTVAVSKSGNGSGTVTSAPAGIDCGSTCSHGYAYGTSVTLTATPSTGSSFTGWTGACTGTGTCTVTTNDATAVTATFALIPETLTVSTKGDGRGSVSSSPVGISCGSTCSRDFLYGSSVTLTQKAAKGSAFTGWSGACSGKGTCTVSMTSTESVSATFVKDCSVPKLKGKSLKAAKRLLRSHDCRTGKIKHAFSKKVKKGRVISQKPKPHRLLKHGAKVGLVVSKGRG